MSADSVDEKVDYKKEELKSEVELKLHLHQPRAGRIDQDIKNVREGGRGVTKYTREL